MTSPATSISEDTSAPVKGIELDDSDMFNDSDDEMLSQALDDAETSMNSSGEAAHSGTKGRINYQEGKILVNNKIDIKESKLVVLKLIFVYLLYEFISWGNTFFV